MISYNIMCSRGVMTQKITADFLANATAAAGKRLELTDPACKGLRIRISGGAKTFAFVHRPKGGKASTITLGHFPDMTLAKARKLADERRGAASDGRDVQAEVRTARAESGMGQKSFKMLVAEYMVTAVAKKRSWETDQRHLDHFITGWPGKDGKPRIAAWGSRKAVSISRGEISAALTTIAADAPISANRHHASLHRLFNWAIGDGKVPDGFTHPMRKMEKRAAEKERKRKLSPDELHRVWRELSNPDSEIGAVTRDALKVILLTAQRPGEVAGMLTAEITIAGDTRLWTIPQERAKNKWEHLAPLTKAAFAIIRANIAGRENPVAVFVSRTMGDRPMNRHSLPHACADIAVKLKIEHFVAHDLRRTAASIMRSSNVSPHVIEGVLAHLPSKLERTYQDFDPVPERRAALEVLAARISEIVGR